MQADSRVHPSSASRPADPSPPRAVGWRSRDVVRVVGIVVLVYLTLQLLWLGRSVFLIAFLAVLFGLSLSAAADYLTRWRIPRGLGVVLVVVAVIGSLAGLAAIAAPKIASQTQQLRTELPQAIDRVETWLQSRYGGALHLLSGSDSTTAGGPAATAATAGDSTAAPVVSIREGLASQLGRAGMSFMSVFSSTLSALAGLILIVFVAIYVAVQPEVYHEGLMHLFPHRMRDRAGEVLSGVATMLRRWLVTQFIAMVVIGGVTTIVLLLLGVRGAVALGIIAGLLEFVPYVGPIMSAVPAVAMGFLGGPQLALWVAVAYLMIQQAENHLLIPLLMKRGLDLPPVVTILSQAIMGLVFGILGLLVAMPLVAMIVVLVKMLYVQDVVGDAVAVAGEGGDS